MASTKTSKNEEEDKKKKKKKKKKKDKNKEAAVTPKSPVKRTPASSPTQEKEKKKKKKKHNATSNGVISEPSEVLIIPSSSCDSQGPQDETAEENAKRIELNNRTTKPKKSNKRKEKSEADNEDGEDGTMCRFPMARIKRIMKSEDPALQVTQDVVFLVNRATEKFIEQFCEEAYGCSVKDRKNYLAYKHLSSAVSKQRRFEFLSDFVPERLKAEDALSERKLMENRQG